MTSLTDRAVGLVEDAEFLAEHGVGVTLAAERLRYSESTLTRTLYRAKRHDLVQRLMANEGREVPQRRNHR